MKESVKPQFEDILTAHLAITPQDCQDHEKQGKTENVTDQRTLGTPNISIQYDTLDWILK